MKQRSNDKSLPLVSVIISVFNEEKYIQGSIESILNQTYNNFEIIVIDDYCTDNSVQIIESIKDKRIRLFRKTIEPRFLASSRNIGIDLALGDYVLLHDADDTCEKDRLEKQLSVALKFNCEIVVGCFVNKILTDGHKILMTLPEIHDDIIKGFTRTRNRTTIVPGTILTSTAVLRRFKYNVNLKYTQDWDHILRLYESGQIRFHNVPEYLYNYYQWPNKSSSKTDWLDYNLLIRINQRRRRIKKEEFVSLSAMYTYFRINPFDGLYWTFILNLIKLHKLFLTKTRKA